MHALNHAKFACMYLILMILYKMSFYKVDFIWISCFSYDMIYMKAFINFVRTQNKKNKLWLIWNFMKYVNKVKFLW